MDSLTGVGSVPSPKSKKTRKAKVSVDPAPLEPTTLEDEVPAVMDEDFPAEMEVEDLRNSSDSDDAFE